MRSPIQVRTAERGQRFSFAPTEMGRGNSPASVSPWENGYVESFNGKVRDELLNPELFDTLLEAQVLTERWRRVYNGVRPHSSLGYKPPAPEARLTRPGSDPASDRTGEADP